jgi:hypothetical protein
MVKSEFIDQIRNSVLLGGTEFETVLNEERRLREIAEEEQRKVNEWKVERSFVPHLWFIHERSVSSPIFVVGFFGVDHFKRIELPPSNMSVEDDEKKRDAVENFLRLVLSDPENGRYIKGVFGQATYVLYRDQYRHSYVYEISSESWVGGSDAVPRVGTASIDISGKKVPYFVG